MMQYRLARTIGGKGTAPDKFAATLRGVAVDSQGKVYAAGDSELKVFGASGELRRRWLTSKPGLSVAVAGDGSVYVGQSGQIEIYDGAGKLINTWRNPELLGRVTALDFVKDSVLAADAADRAIRRFDLGGGFRNTIGKDNRMKGFRIPNGVVDFSVDAGDVIHAANPGKHRVERYTPAGELLGHFGRFDGIDPSGFPGCCNPTNVAVAGCDRIVVTEKAGPRAKLYHFSGTLLAVIATDVFDPNCKNMDVAADSRGRVYVADTVRLAVNVFEPVTGGEGAAGA
jgi:hypothetical protein